MSTWPPIPSLVDGFFSSQPFSVSDSRQSPPLRPSIIPAASHPSSSSASSTSARQSVRLEYEQTIAQLETLAVAIGGFDSATARYHAEALLSRAATRPDFTTPDIRFALNEILRKPSLGAQLPTMGLSSSAPSSSASSRAPSPGLQRNSSSSPFPSYHHSTPSQQPLPPSHARSPSPSLRTSDVFARHFSSYGHPNSSNPYMHPPVPSIPSHPQQRTSPSDSSFVPGLHPSLQASSPSLSFPAPPHQQPQHQHSSYLPSDSMNSIPVSSSQVLFSRSQSSGRQRPHSQPQTSNQSMSSSSNNLNSSVSLSEEAKRLVNAREARQRQEEYLGVSSSSAHQQRFAEPSIWKEMPNARPDAAELDLSNFDLQALLQRQRM